MSSEGTKDNYVCVVKILSYVGFLLCKLAIVCNCHAFARYSKKKKLFLNCTNIASVWELVALIYGN